jgi:hypothetical protein
MWKARIIKPAWIGAAPVRWLRRRFEFVVFFIEVQGAITSFPSPGLPDGKGEEGGHGRHSEKC